MDSTAEVGRMEQKELEKIIERNREIFIKGLLGEKTNDERTDFCWFCNYPFQESEAMYCEECLCYKCPYCSKCFCNLPPIAQQALEREMISLGLWHLNPRKRKRRSSNVIRGATKEDFLEFCRRYYPSLLADYEDGRVSFEELRARVEADVGLVWVF